MFEFLLSFSIGLLLSCPPWFLVGLFKPALAVPIDPPTRSQVLLRYALVAPAVGVLLLLTSPFALFGVDSFSVMDSLTGWLAGLAAIPVEVFVERRVRRWRTRVGERRAAARRDAEARRMQMMLEAQQRESGMRVLDPAALPADADDTVRTLAAVKLRLVEIQRPDVAILTDRLYSRYTRTLDAIGNKFDPREITYQRSRGLVVEVARGAADALDSMASVAQGVSGIDVHFARRRLTSLNADANPTERDALSRRLALVDESEQRLRELAAQVEAALTALDDTSVAVSRVELGRSQSSQAAEQALAELRRFADRAESYGRLN